MTNGTPGSGSECSLLLVELSRSSPQQGLRQQLLAVPPTQYSAPGARFSLRQVFGSVSATGERFVDTHSHDDHQKQQDGEDAAQRHCVRTETQHHVTTYRGTWRQSSSVLPKSWFSSTTKALSVSQESSACPWQNTPTNIVMIRDGEMKCSITAAEDEKGGDDESVSFRRRIWVLQSSRLHSPSRG